MKFMSAILLILTVLQYNIMSVQTSCNKLGRSPLNGMYDSIIRGAVLILMVECLKGPKNVFENRK